MPRHFSTHRIVCWRITQHCNRHCSFCLSRSGSSYAHPNVDPLAILDRLIQIGVKKISYSGGEPLSVPGIANVVESAASLGVLQILTTNGDRLLRTLPAWLGLLEYIKLSFYGNEELHDHYMGSDHYRSQMDLSRRLQEDLGVIVGANFMVTPHSLPTVPEFLVSSLRAGIDNVMFQTYILNGRPDVDDFLRVRHPNGVIDILRSHATPFKGRFVGGVKVHDYSKKNWFVIVSPEGVLELPASDGGRDFIMGSVFDEVLSLPNGQVLAAKEALESIWCTRYDTDAIIVFDEGVSR